MLIYTIVHDFFRNDMLGLTLMWLGFMSVVFISVGRVIMLIREQIIAERSYRLYLATRRAAELREARTNS